MSNTINTGFSGVRNLNYDSKVFSGVVAKNYLSGGFRVIRGSCTVAASSVDSITSVLDSDGNQIQLVAGQQVFVASVAQTSSGTRIPVTTTGNDLQVILWGYTAAGTNSGTSIAAVGSSAAVAKAAEFQNSVPYVISGNFKYMTVQLEVANGAVLAADIDLQVVLIII